MALSAAYRTGQRFGAAYLSDVLQGKDDDRIQRFKHDKLKVFGVGAEHDANVWRSVFRQLIARSMLTTDIDRKGGLKLTELARPVLVGEEPLYFRVDDKPAKRKKARSGKTVSTEHAGLWEELRTLRSEIAKEQGVPAYVIFHDATLMEMVENRPLTLGAMSAVSGVGAAKLEKYGQQFLDAINNTEKESLSDEEIQSRLQTELSKGTPIDAMAANSDLPQAKIDSGLVALASAGELTIEAITSDLNEEQQQEIEAEILFSIDTGEQSLQPLSERLGGRYSLSLLRVARAAVKSEAGVE